MDTKQLAKLLKGVSAFVSTDTTRGVLTRMYVPNGTEMVATDGHKLISVEVKKGHGLATGFYDVKQAIALCKAGLAPQADTTGSYTFPDYRLVIPQKAPEGGKGVQVIGLSMTYLSEVADGMRQVLSAFGGAGGMHVQLGEDKGSPVRFEASYYEDVTVVAVLMPMRL